MNYQVNSVFSQGALDVAYEAGDKANNAERQVEYMKQDIERLLMITEALWKLLQKANGYTDEELKALINEIDLRDGVLDGRVTKKESLPCPSCQRLSSVRHLRCIYCGQVLQHDPFGR